MDDDSLPDGGEPTTVLDGPPLASAPAVEVPTRIGRFAVLRRIGEGGMGIVYAAYDEQLDRRVALKLLRPGGRDGSEGRGRLRREAQALARLSHPNVVQVYEVGDFGDSVYLAMELVRGRNLREWVAAESPPVRTRLEVLLQAGAGLAAAHGAGLTHRDFKPENVLVGDDGRVRVVDFGVARLHGAVEAEPTAAAVRSAGEGLATWTQAGVIVGTPSYMAPELWRGDAADPASDQFAFCVVAHELLLGVRPFSGSDAAALQQAIERGVPTASPNATALPARLRRAVLRGLAVDRAARWPTLAALLEVLRTDVARRRRWVGALALGAVALAAGGYALGRREQAPPDPCAHASDDFAALWPDERRASLHASLSAVPRPWASATAAKVDAGLTRYAQRLQQLARDGCAATWVRRERSEALLDRQRACLRAAAQDFDALVGVLADASVTTLERAGGAVAELPALERCDDPAALVARVAPPQDEATAAAVAAMRSRVAQTRAEHRAGGTGAQLVGRVAAMVDEAAAIGFEPLRAEVLQLHGGVLQSSGQHEAAVERFERAWTTALGCGHDELALDAATSLTYLVGDTLARFEQGQRWGRDAEAMLRRTGAQGRRAGWVANNVGAVLYREGRIDAARARYLEAIAAVEQLDPPEPEALASFLNNLGNCEVADGDHVGARAHYERAIALREDSLGPQHPALLSPLNNLASVVRVGGDEAGGLRVIERAIALADGVGIDPIRRAHTHMNYGSALGDAQRHEEALAHEEIALQLYREHGDPGHPNVGIALANSGNDLVALGRVQQGCDRAREAVALLERALGPEHPQLAVIRGAHAACLAQLGRVDESLAQYALVLQVYNESNTVDPQLGVIVRGMGEVLAQRGRLPEATVALERALAIHGTRGGPEELGRTALALAKLLHRAGRDGARVQRLAQLARDAFTRAGRTDAAAAVDTALRGG